MEGQVAGEFEVFGPYEVDREGVHEKKWQKEAWEWVNKKVGADLAGARGVYVFSLRHGKKLTPLYVGMTTKAFRSEVFALHNTNKFATKWRTYRGTNRSPPACETKGRAQWIFQEHFEKPFRDAGSPADLHVSAQQQEADQQEKHQVAG